MMNRTKLATMAAFEMQRYLTSPKSMTPRCQKNGLSNIKTCNIFFGIEMLSYKTVFHYWEYFSILCKPMHTIFKI